MEGSLNNTQCWNYYIFLTTTWNILGVTKKNGGVTQYLKVEVVGFPILNIYFTIETQTRCNKYKT